MNVNIGFGATINGLHTYKYFGLVIGNTDMVGSPAVKATFAEAHAHTTSGTTATEGVRRHH